MKKTSADKVELSSFDNLFGQEQSMIDDIVEISLTEIHSFKGHPFRVEEDVVLVYKCGHKKLNNL